MTPPTSTKENVLFCPTCQGAAVDASALAGGTASCRSCGWSGKREELLVREINHEFSSPDEVMRFFANDLRITIASSLGQPLGRLLLKWGFVPSNGLDAKLLGRYMTAAARGVAKEILAERERIELEAAQAETQKGSNHGKPS